MNTSFLVKMLIAAGLSLSIIACNDHKPKKTTITEVKLEDIKQEGSTPEPPPPPPPGPVPPIKLTRCFTNEGLKYVTIIRLGSNDNQVAGYVESREIATDKMSVGSFEGTKTGNELKVEFNPENTAPVIGDASEWTNKAWTLKKVAGKEILRIIFNAKNHETNKWEETVYEFEPGDCGK